MLFDVLNEIPQDEEIYVLLYGLGGQINAARRIALLLHSRFKHVNYIVPYSCESSFTTLVLSAKTVYTGPMSSFTPIDTHLEMYGEDAASNGSIDSEDVRLYPTMVEEWFGISLEDDAETVFASIAPHIYPTTFTSLYRSIKEQQSIAHELLNLNPTLAQQQIKKTIADKLIFGYHSHTYSLTGEDLRKLGLPIVEDNDIFKIAWDAVNNIRQIIGGGARNSLDDPRNDCLIMTTERLAIRQNFPNAFRPRWFEKKQ
jgi:hypothetical protein